MSSKTGLMLYQTKDKFFDKHDIVEFLELLRKKKPKGKLAVFWDNCATHFSKAASDAASKLRIVLIRNVPYKPEFNGIERVWARMKWIFRRTVLRKKIDKEPIKLKEIVPEVASKMSSKLCHQCALNGWKMLQAASDKINGKE